MSAIRVAHVPALQPGDRLAPDEFLRRYEAMPELKKAELINGVVHMPMAVSDDFHGAPHFCMVVWMGVYAAYTPGVKGGDNSTLKKHLGLNVPQPDAYLRFLTEYGGQSRIEDGFIVGAPELIAEIAASSASYDLHDKLHAYERNSVREYIVWRTEDKAIDWFVLKAGKYHALKPTGSGILKSKAFPRLWLDVPALLRGDMAAVLSKVQEGLASSEHKRFAIRMRNKIKS
jgi:Uma2 family endonuclease